MNLKELKAEVKKLRTVHCPPVSKLKKADLQKEYERLKGHSESVKPHVENLVSEVKKHLTKKEIAAEKRANKPKSKAQIKREEAEERRQARERHEYLENLTPYQRMMLARDPEEEKQAEIEEAARTARNKKIITELELGKKVKKALTKAVQKKKINKWLYHVAAFRKAHPGLSGKEVLIEAKKSYK